MCKRNLTIFTFFVTLLCVAARVICLTYATESQTGFFTERLSSVGLSLTVIPLLLAFISIFFSFFVKEKVSSNFKQSKKTAIISVLFGACIFLYSVGLSTHTSTVYWQHLLEVITGVLCAVWFIFFGIGRFLDIKLPSVTYIMPTLHWIMRLIVVFSSFSTTSLVAEHIFSLFSNGFTLLFMLSMGKYLTDCSNKKDKKALFPLATASFILNTTSALSRLIVFLLGHSDKIHFESSVDIVSLCAVIFIALITFDIFKNKEEKINEI